MRNCSYCKIILEISQAKGSETPNMGVVLSPLLIIKQGIKFCDS